MSVYNCMEVAAELMTICNSETSDNSSTSHILYVLCMILQKQDCLTKKPTKYCLLLLLFCNASDGLVFKHTTADISNGHIKTIVKLCNVYNTVFHRLKVELMTIFNTVSNYCITNAEARTFHDHKISNLSFSKQ